MIPPFVPGVSRQTTVGMMTCCVGSLGALEEKFPITRTPKQPSKQSEREASHNNLLSLLEQSSEEAHTQQGQLRSQLDDNSLAAQVNRLVVSIKLHLSTSSAST